MNPKIRTLVFFYAIIIGIHHAAAQTDSDFKPRVLLITDLCQSCGNNNDLHSLVYLLWNLDQIELVGVHSNDLDSVQGSTGPEAWSQVVEAYTADFRSESTSFSSRGFPSPEDLRALAPNTFEDSVQRVIEAAAVPNSEPLYVLNWSNMRTIRTALERAPSILPQIRLITVSTRTNFDNCREPNWNGWSRDPVYRDPRFKKLWWLEMDWTPPALIQGEDASQLVNLLGRFGQMGSLLLEEGGSPTGERKFGGSDALSLLYLLDERQRTAGPTESGWAGRYVQPEPEDRPSYFTDDMGPYEWDYDKPCRTWIDRKLALKHCQEAVVAHRTDAFASLTAQLNALYPAQASTQSLLSYEAEDARVSAGLVIRNDLTASDGYYVEMKGSGEIVWTIPNVPSSGEYILHVRYRLPFLHKTQSLKVNGNSLGGVKFDGPSRVWQEKEIPVRLQEGTNEIVIEKDWGYVDFDLITLSTEAA